MGNRDSHSKRSAVRTAVRFLVTRAESTQTLVASSRRQRDERAHSHEVVATHLARPRVEVALFQLFIRSAEAVSSAFAATCSASP